MEKLPRESKKPTSCIKLLAGAAAVTLTGLTASFAAQNEVPSRIVNTVTERFKPSHEPHEVVDIPDPAPDTPITVHLPAKSEQP